MRRTWIVRYEYARMFRQSMTAVGERSKAQIEIEKEKEYRLDSKEADLKNVYLEDANLERANLYRANLEGAVLISSNLDGVHLDSANLEGAGFWRQFSL